MSKLELDQKKRLSWQLRSIDCEVRVCFTDQRSAELSLALFQAGNYHSRVGSWAELRAKSGYLRRFLVEVPGKASQAGLDVKLKGEVLSCPWGTRNLWNEGPEILRIRASW
jgi:hypothetical protein